MAIVQCGCCQCSKPLLKLVWYKQERMILVECPDCGSNMQYDLDTLIDTLGPLPNDSIEYMLQNFQPQGRPS